MLTFSRFLFENEQFIGILTSGEPITPLTDLSSGSPARCQEREDKCEVNVL